MVTVLPISHTPPADPELAVELPAATKRRLGLDDERSWVVLPKPIASCGRVQTCGRLAQGTLQALPMDCCRLGYSNHPAAIHRRDPGAPCPNRAAQLMTDAGGGRNPPERG
jgi:hypothetical protein